MTLSEPQTHPDAARVEMPAFFDERRISPYQYVIVLLCGLVMFLDGFDTQAISYAAPYIAAEWGLSQKLLGPIFSSSLIGLMLGYLAISPLSDRFGHRAMIIASTIIFGIATVGAVWAGSVTHLIALRFIVGVGLGACIPSAIAMTAEFSPKRLRATFVLVIYCGFSLGFVAAGLTAGALIPNHGWRSMFWVGGLAPLLLVPLLFHFLPESITHMVRKGANPGKILRVLRRIEPGLSSDSVVTVAEEAGQEGRGVALGRLFTRDRIAGTLLLWVVFAINLGAFYALQSWLPSILMGLDHPLSVVVAATTLTTVGGIAVVAVIGPCMDRIGSFRTLAALYFLGFLFVGLAAFSFTAPLWLLLFATFLSGCAISGGQKSVIALAAVFYPAAIRSTGLGWALGIGRLGGILGPLIVGLALGGGWSPFSLFLTMAVLMLVNSLIISWLGHKYED